MAQITIQTNAISDAGLAIYTEKVKTKIASEQEIAIEDVTTEIAVQFLFDRTMNGEVVQAHKKLTEEKTMEDMVSDLG